MNPDKVWWRAFDPRSTIAARAAVIFAAGGAALTVLLAFVSGEFLHRHLETSTAAAFQHLAAQVAFTLERDLADRATEIQRLAGSELLSSNYGSPIALSAVRRKVLEPFGLAWLGLTDEAGVVIAASGEHLEGTSMARERWFFNGQNRPYIGPVLPDPRVSAAIENEALFIALSAPVQSPNGRLLGVLGAQVFWNYDPQTSPLPRSATQDGIIASVYETSGGKWLLSSDGSGDRTSLPAPMAGRESKGFRRETFDGIEYVTGFARSPGYRGLPGRGWTIAVRQAAQNVFAPVAALRHRILSWGLTLAGLLAVPPWLLGLKMGRRLRAVATSAERIRSGDVLAVMPQFRARDELGSMSTSVAQLVAELRAPKLPTPAPPPSKGSPPPESGSPSTDYVRPSGADPRRVVW